MNKDLTPSELSRLVGIPRPTVYLYVKTGVLKPILTRPSMLFERDYAVNRIKEIRKFTLKGLSIKKIKEDKLINV